MTRKQFIALAAAGPFTLSAASAAEKPEKLDPEKVREFVGKCHSDFDVIQAMLAEEPALINAAWDWGYGDWETGLGAASHTGRRNIAELLLEKGARVDAFAAAMLGRLEIIRTLLDAFPAIHATPGPHGIPLISHAIYGTDQAWASFQAILESGADINQAANNGTTPLMDAAQSGHLEAAKALLAAGADPAATDERGRTALVRAEERKQQALVELLSKA